MATIRDRLQPHVRSVRQAASWLVVEVMIGLALVLWAAGLSGIATNLLVLVAAVTGVVTLIWQRSDATAQHSKLEQQSSDIRKLAELAERTHAIQLAQQPDPTVAVLDPWTSEEPPVAGRSEVERQPMVVIDRDAILAKEVYEQRRPAAAEPSGAEGIARALVDIAAQQSRSYQTELNRYERRLLEWLAEVEAYFSRHYELVSLPIRITNRGGGPVEDAELLIELPEGVSATELPEQPDDPPDAPAEGWGNLNALLKPSFPYIDPIRVVDAGPLRGPWSSPEGARYTYRMPQLLHGRSLDAAEDADADPMIASVRTDGEYGIAWQLHAANMHQPAVGSFVLAVRTSDSDPVRISTIETLRSVLWPSEDERE